jgi:nucleotide-binding universal stress UspA family protein
MQRILVPVDGSEPSSHALAHAIALSRRCGAVDIEVVNVQAAIDGLVQKFVSQAMIDEYHRTEGEAALAPARALLAAAGTNHQASMRVGGVAETIVDHAARTHCDLIVMGTRGLGAVGGMVMGSVATKVVHLAGIPVTLVK